MMFLNGCLKLLKAALTVSVFSSASLNLWAYS